MDILRTVCVATCLLYSQVVTVSACPAGWTDANGLCLTFHTDSKNWDQAEAVCSAAQGHLADIRSKDENEAVIAFRQAQAQLRDPVWLGMRKETGSWKWTDGSPLTWTSWENGAEPAHDTFSCGTLATSTDGSTLFWSGFPCVTTLAFICRYQDAADNQVTKTEVSGNWRKLAQDQQYTGQGQLLTLTSPSSISCVTKCQSTDTCNAVTFNPQDGECQLITGGVDMSQLTSGADTEVWIQNV